MKRLVSCLLAMVLAAGALTGCSTREISTGTTLVDGTYKAEFRDYDANGWKDYVELTVKDGELYEVVYDSASEKGTKLKSEDEGYKADMEAIVGTYPAKYSKDLINQFLESGKVTAVDIVAGATESTGNFKTLVMAVMKAAADGDTETVIVENLE